MDGTKRPAYSDRMFPLSTPGSLLPQRQGTHGVLLKRTLFQIFPWEPGRARAVVGLTVSLRVKPLATITKQTFCLRGEASVVGLRESGGVGNDGGARTDS